MVWSVTHIAISIAKKFGSGNCHNVHPAETPDTRHKEAFANVVRLIEQARTRVYQTVNTEMIDLYWRIGEYVSNKVAAAEWGRGTVSSLATYIQICQPGLRGFSASNIWRMRQFFDTYGADSILAPLVRELPWTHNLIILSLSKQPAEREFYLRMAIKERWSKRELERQFNTALFARVMLNPPKMSPVLTETQPQALNIFKDSYVVDFLNLPEPHSEADLQRGLIVRLKQFLCELGRDFCFVVSEFPIQVGKQDFALDLLFFHRGLNALVAIELKVERFSPAHLGQLNFYLEALDRDHKKAHENPAIGVLLCASKDDEVVEYALSRSLSPATIAEYQTRLPDKKMLQAKLHEFYMLNLAQQEAL